MSSTATVTGSTSNAGHVQDWERFVPYARARENGRVIRVETDDSLEDLLSVVGLVEVDVDRPLSREGIQIVRVENEGPTKTLECTLEVAGIQQLDRLIIR